MISIIHPSRGRALKAAATCEKWLDNYNGYNGAEYIFSLDNDDGDLKNYKLYFLKIEKQFPSIKFRYILADNKNVVDAMNKGAKIATGDLLVCISDDFDCFVNWNDALLKEADLKKEMALLVNDGINYGGKTRMALPILTKKLYDRLGYIYYPQYTGLFADDDLKEVCQKLGVLKTVQHLLFQHNHYVNGKAMMDDTYKRHNTQMSFNLGQQILAKRRAAEFQF